MRNALLAGVFVLFQPWPLASESVFERFIVWNVGQGQWTTWIHGDVCTHFDAGGERPPPLRLLRSVCGQRENQVQLSHWDWDHVSFVGRVRGWVSRVCLGPLPLGPVPSLRKQKLVAGIPACHETPAFLEIAESSLRDRARGGDRDRVVARGGRQRVDSNALSRVWVIGQRILVSGDSPARLERQWLWRIPRPERIRISVLGHHGSRTSTSEELLSRLTGLRQAVVSARFAKYGHPHKETVQKTKRHKVPLLKTEDWGNLIYEL